MKRAFLLISSFSILIILPLLSVYVQAHGQNMTSDDDVDKDNDDDFLIYGKSIFGLSIKYPVSTWVVEEGERSFYPVDRFATFCPKNELVYSSVSEKNECDILDSTLDITIDHLNHNKTIDELINQETSFAREYNSTDIKKQNNTLDGNPAIIVTSTFVYDFPLSEYSTNLKKEFAEQEGKTYIPEKDSDDIEVYKRIQIITIKNNVGYIVTYTAPKLEFENYIDNVNKMIETLRILPLPYCYTIKGDTTCKFEDRK